MAPKALGRRPDGESQWLTPKKGPPLSLLLGKEFIILFNK